jgi:hypothetical protein
LLNTFRNARWNGTLEFGNIGAINSLAKSSRDHIGTHSKKLICNLSSAKVLTRESSDESSIRAIWVELRVDTSLIEGLHLEFRDSVIDDPASVGRVVVVEDAILGEHFGDETTLSDDLEFNGTGVYVWSVEAAWPKKANCHTGSGAYKRGERLAVCGDEISTFASLAFQCRIAEVEDEIGIGGEEGEAVNCSISEEELGCEGETGG